MINQIRNTAMAAIVLLGTVVAPAQASDTVRIGWTTWDDAEVVSKMAALVIRKALKQPVNLTLSDINIQYRSVANGELDAMMMAWLPETHKDYMAKYGDDLVEFSTLYSGAKLGMAVNEHCDAEVLNTIDDLKKPEAVAALDGRIYGIDPNSGIMSMTRNMLSKLGSDLVLEEGTSFSMAREVEKANQSGQCVAFPMWNPHWMFGAMNIRYLEDPDRLYGGEESIKIVVRKGFEDDFPKVAKLFRNMQFELTEVESILAEAKQSDAEKAVRNWIKSNQNRVMGWLQ